MTQIPDKDTIRNSDLNISDWTLSSRQHKNVKRLAQTFVDVVRAVKAKEKIAIKCDKCNQSFRTVKGILPKHNIYRHYFSYTTTNELCIGGKSVLQSKLFKSSSLKELEINDIIYKKNDVVLIEKCVNLNILPYNTVIKSIVFEVTIISFKTCENSDVSIVGFTYDQEGNKHNYTFYLSNFVKKEFDIIKV